MMILVRLLLPGALVLMLGITSYADEAKPDHIFLLIGQSNMAGRAALEPEDKVEIDGCLLWNGQGWEKAKPGFNRYSTHRKEKFVQGMNCGPSFVEAYRKANPGITVGIICWARGGTSIEQWHPDSSDAKAGDLYNEAVKQTREALKLGGHLKGILWHQGESNSRRSSKYGDLLVAHVERLRKDFGDAQLPFVFGQIGRWKDTNDKFNQQIVAMPETIPYSACVSSKGLTDFDSSHFDRESQIEFGKRYAAAVLELLAKQSVEQAP